MGGAVSLRRLKLKVASLVVPGSYYSYGLSTEDSRGSKPWSVALRAGPPKISSDAGSYNSYGLSKGDNRGKKPRFVKLVMPTGVVLDG